MKEFTYRINDELGLHARPAGMLAKLVKGLPDTAVTIVKDGKEVGATKLLAIMGLAVKQGEEVTVRIEGGDEESAAKTVEEFFSANL